MKMEHREWEEREGIGLGMKQGRRAGENPHNDDIEGKCGREGKDMTGQKGRA